MIIAEMASSELLADIVAVTRLIQQAEQHGDAVGKFQMTRRRESLAAELAARQRPMSEEVAAVVYANRENWYE